METITWPTVEAMIAWLEDIKKDWAEEAGEEGIDVRLRVYQTSRKTWSWSINWGDSSYDQDHRGFWGCGFLDAETDCRELAESLIEQCQDHAADSAALEV